MAEYRGITHLVPSWLLGLWRRFMCPRERHAFDEVWSIGDHFLSCDACGLMLNIDSFDDRFVDPAPPSGGRT